ncbi:MAG: GAF domain-containing protein [Candidatus Melainabacteria bacterium]|nr:GAF domain-containing protein [Candidatus Melainabacteria bacterium]
MASRRKKKAESLPDLIAGPGDYLGMLLSLRQSLGLNPDASMEERFRILERAAEAACLSCRIARLDDSGRVGWKRFIAVGPPAEIVFSLEENSIALNSFIAGDDLEIASLLEEARPRGCFEDWLRISGDESGAVFPLILSGELRGLMFLSSTDSDIRSLGRLISSELTLGLTLNESRLARRLADWLFSQCPLPVFLLERASKRLVKVNRAVEGVFSARAPDKRGSAVSVLHLVEAAADGVDEKNPFAWSSIDLEGLDYEAMMTCLLGPDAGEVYIVLIPAGFLSAAGSGILVSPTPSRPVKRGKPADPSDSLGRQLVFERLIRQVISRLHSSLDMNSVLQLLVDNVGQCLSVSRCLAVRSELATLPVVTHEYAEPSISPLGLGRTARFPSSVVARFRNGPVAIDDVTSLRSVRSIPSEDVSSLLDAGISSLAGAPIVSHGSIYGAVIAIELGRNRKWTDSELELIRVAAGHASVSLGHCQTHQQIKDQIFHANLLSNLTKQLNNSLELANLRSGTVVEKSKSCVPEAEAPPLSVREMEVLKLIASGLSNKEIANRLFLTASTVELHASRIRKKLGLRSRTALVKYACDNGLA